MVLFTLHSQYLRFTTTPLLTEWDLYQLKGNRDIEMANWDTNVQRKGYLPCLRLVTAFLLHIFTDMCSKHPRHI